MQSCNVSYNTIGATIPQTSTEQSTSVLPLPVKAPFTYSATQKNAKNKVQGQSNSYSTPQQSSTKDSGKHTTVPVQFDNLCLSTPVRPLPKKARPKKMKQKKIYSSASKKNNQIQGTSNQSFQQSSSIGTEEYNTQIPNEIEEQHEIVEQHEIDDFGPGTSNQTHAIPNEIDDIGLGKRSLLYNILSLFFII